VTGPPSPPGRLIVVTATGTEVGKTWVAARLIADLRRRGATVVARKPAQSFDPGEDVATDAERLAEATGEHPDVVCPPGRRYPRALAPPMAAAALGRTGFTIADLAGEITSSWPVPPPDVAVVETAGGVASPQADDGDAVSLAEALAADVVVVVALAGLGSINLVRLCHRALGPRPVVVHLNRWDGLDPVGEANRRWLIERDALVVTTTMSELADAISIDCLWEASEPW